MAREEFVLRVPDAVKSEMVGPILCAGITVYSPMKHWNLQKGQKLGVAGIGGLGHMAIQLGKVLGAEVIAFTRSPEKEDAILKLGADKVVISTDDKQMKSMAQSLDLLINTITCTPQSRFLHRHDAARLRSGGRGELGQLPRVLACSTGVQSDHRSRFSYWRGIAETQEVLESVRRERHFTSDQDDWH